MSKGPERYSQETQKANKHEKMLNLINNLGNACQNPSVIKLHF